jgi:hypothetical protein
LGKIKPQELRKIPQELRKIKKGKSMTTTATKEKEKKAVNEDKSPDRIAGEKLAPAIAKAIIRVMGKPPNLWQIRVHHLWDNRFRVGNCCQ